MNLIHDCAENFSRHLKNFLGSISVYAIKYISEEKEKSDIDSNFISPKIYVIFELSIHEPGKYVIYFDRKSSFSEQQMLNVLQKLREKFPGTLFEYRIDFI